MAKTLLSIIFWVFLGLNSHAFINLSNLERLKPCEYLGTICSDDCTRILTCNVIGENPVPVKRCDIEVDGFEYCHQVNATVATCTAEQRNCSGNDASKGIKCGTFGEFPHPQNCDMTVKCAKGVEQPTDLCHCPLGYYNDISRPSLPCVAAADCPRRLIDCNYVGQNGNYPGSLDFCYTCADNNATWVYYCESTRNHMGRSFPEERVTKMCEELTPPENRSGDEKTGK